jgi:hypothetical protein
MKTTPTKALPRSQTPSGHPTAEVAALKRIP